MVLLIFIPISHQVSRNYRNTARKASSMVQDMNESRAVNSEMNADAKN
jgi:hypothetical protein